MAGSDDQDQILTPKVLKLLQRILRDLFAYFGIYYFAAQLDTIFTLKDDSLENLSQNPQFLSSVVLLELSLIL